MRIIRRLITVVPLFLLIIISTIHYSFMNDKEGSKVAHWLNKICNKLMNYGNKK